MPHDFPVRILFVGDMHLGRRASRVPGAVWDLGGFSARDISPVAAWEATVQAALDRQVAAVALAGDLVHQDDDLFEARGHLERGIGRLTAAGIRVVAVAGNHDTRIMPVLAEVIPELELLGPGGSWTTSTVAPGVRLAGWSFPARHHATSPLLAGPPPPQPGVVTIGLLHADRDAARSSYAPVAGADLLAVGYEGWALGHVHAPDPVPGPQERRPFYLGAVTGVIPTETGAHGPVLATVAAGQVRWQRLVLAPLRWEQVQTSVAGLAVPDDEREIPTALRNHLLQAVADLVPAVPDGGLPPAALGLRITLTGEHRAAAVLQRVAPTLARDDLVTRDAGGVIVFIDKVTSEVGVPVDLAQLAGRQDPPGLLARQILALTAGAPETAALLAHARLAVGQISAPTGWHEEPWTDDELRGHLIAAGRRALNALLGQDGGARP